MSTAEKIDYVTVEDYLAAEEQSEVRHEYLGGLVYAMAGETRDHNRIVGNLYRKLSDHLRDGPCQLYMSDVRVNFDLKRDEYYYYPDLVVTCDKRDDHPRFIRFPRIIIEVLSPSTERVDKREKFFAYTTVESLEEYVLVAQDAREVIIARRANEWRKEVVSGPEAVATLASLGCMLPLSAIYEGV
jgi:Uma2 family endonuclease